MNRTPWYYARGGSTAPSGPVSAADLRGMLADGRLTAEDFVWREGFPAWVRAGAAEELRPAAAPADALAPSLRRWMTLASGFCLAAGIVRCLTVVRLISGILLITAGAALLAARAALHDALAADRAIHPFLLPVRRFLQAVCGVLFLGLLAAVFWIFFYAGFFTGVLKGLARH